MTVGQLGGSDTLKKDDKSLGLSVKNENREKLIQMHCASSVVEKWRLRKVQVSIINSLFIIPMTKVCCYILIVATLQNMEKYK